MMIGQESTGGFTVVTVRVPPGSLGIRLIDAGDENDGGASVAAVNDDSPVAGVVFPNDQVVSINGCDVTGMSSKGMFSLFVPSLRTFQKS